MQTRTANIALIVLAEAFCYPEPGQLEALEEGLADMPAGGPKNSLARFVKKIGRLALGEWEELHTRTLDLNPPAAPYIGFQTWGESYQRGSFLSKMSRALLEAGIDPGGELPDHIAPVLVYLAHVEAPLPELAEAFLPAVRRMTTVLRQADSSNPYIDLLEGVQEAFPSVNKEAA